MRGIALQVRDERSIARRQRHVPEEPLSRREREVLQWCARGKTSWEVARILGITERTVNFHIYQAADKLGARGRQAACVRALLTGQIGA
ncbi:MAG: helix-turn-helix transcriptional regulator [Pseudoxanthomonas suwonensis]|nr:helix-turn-helix transcriptional regulator [Pseudoxanthomonas suwonensis]